MDGAGDSSNLARKKMLISPATWAVALLIALGLYGLSQLCGQYLWIRCQILLMILAIGLITSSLGWLGIRKPDKGVLNLHGFLILCLGVLLSAISIAALIVGVLSLL